MARAARYGNVPPDVFEEMDADEAAEIARRVQELFNEDEKRRMEFQLELTKALIKAHGASVL